ncbi:hypothetical protein G4Z16_15385 [Streptomyces bathyalis]|uniref:Uncharacterized protein n=1 Tax=Streptomyces bathyalis TaxID=2710756 RepID=A0A7T1T6Z4_9ACTN|nr:hypothetical protein [Streptomyces bathyalis]QPP07543.1 hypothetical protein G4Z16_15385 [Streptomyces bathyalis]
MPSRCGYLLAIPDDDELWTAAQAAEHFGYTGPNAAGQARASLRRWGVEPVRPPRPNVLNLYYADEVRSAYIGRPGVSHRSDLD